MAHYRHGRKVPALPPPQRHAVGAATILAVFTLVALTAWRPWVYGLPSLAVIAALGFLDYTVVMTRPVHDDPAVLAARAGLPAADAWYDSYDAGPATTMLPRLPLDAPPPDGSGAPPLSAAQTTAMPRPTRALHPAYEGGFSAEDDILSWDDPDPDESGADDPSRPGRDALVHTMAVDMRGFLGGSASWSD